MRRPAQAALALIALTLAAPLVPATPAEARIIERVVAVVNDEIITSTELEDTAAPVLRQADAIPDPMVREQQRARQLRLALDELVGQRLITQEAQKHKLHVTLDEVDNYLARIKKQQGWDDKQLETYLMVQGTSLSAFRQQTRDQLLRNKVVVNLIGDRIRVSEGDVAEYYKSKLTELHNQYELEAAHIALRVADEASPAEEAAIRQQAVEILKRAQAGEAFDALAKQYSQAPGAENGGSLGVLRKGSLDPGFEEVAFGLADGAIGGPVRSAFGFHVIKALVRRKLPTPQLEEVKGELQRELTDKRQRDEVAKWVEELKKKAFIDLRL
ncbi:peptidylprolyl isomerase [Myxococcota bacterium]|nr:peptidylprolyl isomerase [Myxococcota bacterium]